MNNATKSVPFLVRLARNAAWAPLGVLVLHEIGARMIGHEPYVDPSMHFLGGAAVSFFIRYASSIADRLRAVRTEAALDLIAFGLTCAVALFWEFGEFAADRYLGQHVQKDLEDTMSDLALGVGGSIVYLSARRLIKSSRARAV